MKKLASIILLATFAFSSLGFAQEEARAVWQVTHFDITATPQPAERSLSAVAVLSARNVGKAAGTTFTFRINSKASVKSVAVGGATANFRTVAETRGNLQRITVTLPGSVAPDGITNVSISYTLRLGNRAGR